MAGRPNDKMFKTMVNKHGSEEAARAWFRSIGSRGGSTPTTKPKGFAADIDKAREAGRLGGKNRTGWRKHKTTES